MTKKQIEVLLKAYPELNDLTLRYDDEDKDECCFFASNPKYELKEKIKTYHPHQFTIRINGQRLWICKKHLLLLTSIVKGLHLNQTVEGKHD